MNAQSANAALVTVSRRAAASGAGDAESGAASLAPEASAVGVEPSRAPPSRVEPPAVTGASSSSSDEHAAATSPNATRQASTALRMSLASNKARAVRLELEPTGGPCRMLEHEAL